MLGITGQVMLARALACVVELGIADRVGREPASAEGLATELSLDADAVYRLMRALSANGIFEEDGEGLFHMTPTSAVLVDGEAGSVRDMLRLPWQDLVWRTWLDMPHTLRTGEPAFDKAHGAAFFDYLAANPEANALFDASMALISEPEDTAVAQAMPVDGTDHVVDLGGGRGGLMAAVLARHERVTGAIFDQPQVLAEPSLIDPGHRSRCKAIAGDFFESIVSGADYYVLKRILHDWDDADADRILACCREAAGDTGRLLVVEAIVKPGNAPDPVKTQDLGMMLLTKGRERTEDEYQALFERAGLRLRHVHPTDAPSGVSVLECSPGVGG